MTSAGTKAPEGDTATSRAASCLRPALELDSVKLRPTQTRVRTRGGTILREVEAAAEILESDYGVAADVWSLTSVNELAREGNAVQRWNLLHPEQEQRVPYVTGQLRDAAGPVVAATDYVKLYAEQIRQFVPGRYLVLGTDGFGRSDTRSKLRGFFEVSREYVVIAALRGLADEGAIDAGQVASAIEKLGVDRDKPDPFTV